MTKQKFMALDLLIFSILAGVSEFLSGFLFNYFNSGYYISFSIMITIIALVRWSFWGVVPLLVSGVVAFLMNQNGIMTDAPLTIMPGLLYYVVADLFILLSLIYLKAFKNRDDAVEGGGKLIAFITICFISLIIGKGLAILVIERTLSGFLNYFISISLSYVISLIFLLIFKSKTELVRDMDMYIEEVQMEDCYEREHLESKS